MKKERLDKLIASQGLLSRNDVKVMVRRGEVSVNGAVVKDSSLKVSYEDDIKIKGESLSQTEYIYIMLNKPKGVVSASEDKRVNFFLSYGKKHSAKLVFLCSRNALV